MVATYILPLSDPQATLERVGGKGASLARLSTNGLPVPDGFHILTRAYRDFVSANDLQPKILAMLEQVDSAQPATLERASQSIRTCFEQGILPVEIAGEIVAAYQALPGDNPAVAIRSSATAEDLPEASFAGQQDTYLNVSGDSAVLEASRKCWASLWTARAIAYRLQRKIDQATVDLAVVVQLLVPAESAGVLFTANPLSGARHEVLISAAWGLGEAVVGGMVTPDNLIVDKTSRKVLSRETASKEVMTVRVGGGTAEEPVPEDLRRVPVLDDGAALELADLGKRVEQLYQMPMDIEWVRSDGKFAIVQARPITTLQAPQAVARVEVEWKRPNPKGQYMRGSMVDLIPGPMSPIFESMGLPGVVKGVTGVMRLLTRSEPVLPEEYFTSINSYAYGGFYFSPRVWVWIIFHMVPSYPRMLRMGVSLWREGILPRYAALAAHWRSRCLEELPDADLLDGLRELNAMLGEYVGSLMVGTMGSSAGAEMLFTRVYEKLIWKAGDPAAVAFLMGYNNIPIQAEKSLYDLAQWATSIPVLADYLLETPASDIAGWMAGKAPVPSSPDGLPEFLAQFKARLNAHLAAYGYIIYDMDFANPLPMDDPVPMLEAVKMYLRGEGANPHERQEAAEQKRLQSSRLILARTRGLKRWAFKKALKWAQSMAEVREDAIADIGLGYPSLRAILQEIGRRFQQAGVIGQAGDIFWLREEELEELMQARATGKPLPDLQQAVQTRKRSQQKMRAVVPPPMLPPRKKYMGFDVELFTAATEDSHSETTLKGVGSSAGRATAKACVLHSPQDFDQMQPGNVLVAPITTPAWTPLFAMASAIVTDVGGPLSHGSIVAREYGIPAVLGTGVATRRIRSGQTITVDGSAGTVTLL